MRSIHPILILLFASELAFAKGTLNENITLAQARGLKAGMCYKEVAALSCEKECVLDFFPTTQAQLSLVVHDISASDRKKLGRFFDVEFQFSEKGEAKIISLSSLDSEQLKEKIKNSNGYFGKIRCAK